MKNIKTTLNPNPPTAKPIQVTVMRLVRLSASTSDFSKFADIQGAEIIHANDGSLLCKGPEETFDQWQAQVEAAAGKPVTTLAFSAKFGRKEPYIVRTGPNVDQMYGKPSVVIERNGIQGLQPVNFLENTLPGQLKNPGVIGTWIDARMGLMKDSYMIPSRELVVLVGLARKLRPDAPFPAATPIARRDVSSEITPESCMNAVPRAKNLIGAIVGYWKQYDQEDLEHQHFNQTNAWSKRTKELWAEMCCRCNLPATCWMPERFRGREQRKLEKSGAALLRRLQAWVDGSMQPEAAKTLFWEINGILDLDWTYIEFGIPVAEIDFPEELMATVTAP